MSTYFLKRLLLIPPMILGITLVCFLIIQLAPGEIGEGGGELVEGQQTRARQKILNETFHFDRPPHVRYFYWLGDLLRGDLGRSVTTPSITVAQRILDALPYTLALNIIVVFILYTTSIPIGIFSATHAHSFLDRISTAGLFLLYSLPSFWVAILLIKLMVSLPEGWRLPFLSIFPAGAEEMPTLTLLWTCTQHMVLPVLTLSYAGLATLSRYMRAGMLDIVRSDFIRTARAKGCPETVVIYKHALRNSLIPIITLLGGLLPGLIGGSVIVETIFGIPGMGYLGYNAVLERDFTVLMATLSLSAMLTLLGILVSDFLYVLVDPRISLEKGS